MPVRLMLVLSVAIVVSLLSLQHLLLLLLLVRRRHAHPPLLNSNARFSSWPSITRVHTVLFVTGEKTAYYLHVARFHWPTSTTPPIIDERCAIVSGVYVPVPRILEAEQCILSMLEPWSPLERNGPKIPGLDLTDTPHLTTT